MKPRTEDKTDLSAKQAEAAKPLKNIDPKVLEVLTELAKLAYEIAGKMT